KSTLNTSRRRSERTYPNRRRKYLAVFLSNFSALNRNIQPPDPSPCEFGNGVCAIGVPTEFHRYSSAEYLRVTLVAHVHETLHANHCDWSPRKFFCGFCSYCEKNPRRMAASQLSAKSLRRRNTKRKSAQLKC